MADKDRMESAKGKAKEVAGWAAGDREYEAEGKLDQLDAAGADGDESAEQAVKKAEQDVRREHGDVRS